MAHLDLPTLDARLRALPPPPADTGAIRELVLRLPDERREVVGEMTVDPVRGPIGDRWFDGKANLGAQVTLMRFDVANAMCDGADPAMLGDNWFVDLDLSVENLPAGTQIRVGPVRAVVTDKPHTGCSKFQRRVGADALAITKHADWLAARLRGIHVQVLDGGVVRVGDRIEVIRS